MPQTRAKTLREACDIFEELTERPHREIDIVCLPPDFSVVSDQEDIDEDDMAPQTPLDIAGELEVCYESDPEDEEPKTKRKREKKGSAPARPLVEWLPNETGFKSMDSALLRGIHTKLADKHPELINKTPVELFKLFFDEEIVAWIVTETQRYAAQQNAAPAFVLSAKEVYDFVGVIIYSGLVQVPTQRHYWTRSNLYNFPAVSNKLSRDRFETIRKYLHLADNNELVQGDKMAKVNPFLRIVGKKLMQFGVFEENLSVDEQMIQYYGHHSCKMFMRGKPCRFGYKVWVLCGAGGYPFSFYVYTGKETEAADKPLGTRVVLKLLSSVEHPDLHTVYFDNFFSSYGLLSELRQLNIKATGTVRENRLLKCPFPDNKTFKKSKRGHHVAFSTLDVVAVKWHDNTAVCLVSNHDTVTPLGKAKRWSGEAKKHVDITQPRMIGNYNKNMGGVDLCDRFISNHRPMLRSKKWWWPFFANAVTKLTVAAWRIHREVGGQLSQAVFLTDVVESLLLADVDQLSVPVGRSTTVSATVRFDGVNHTLGNPQNPGRCKVCRKNTARLECKKCKVRLHKVCSLQYHAAN